MIYTRVLRVLAVGASFFFSASIDGAWFMPLPNLPGSTQGGNAFAISADGATVVGMSHNGSALEAVRWTIGAEVTVQPLGAGVSSIGWGVSADGSVIVGDVTSAQGYPVAYRWTPGGGFVLLGDFPGGGEPASVANGVSGDGNIVVGRGRTEQAGEAFRWTAANGLVSLGDLPGGGFGSEAYATSADGSVVVGSSLSARGTEAFRWTAETGMVGLGGLAGGGFFMQAHDVSADGSSVVGRGITNNGLFPSRAVRWTADAGAVALPDIPGVGPTSNADAISSDGMVIVGSASDGDSAAGFAWDPFHGSRSISALLTSQGVDLAGFYVGTARGISADGLTITGNGTPHDGASFQPWVARLDPGTFVPEPSTVVMASVALVVLVVSLFLRWRSGTAYVA